MFQLYQTCICNDFPLQCLITGGYNWLVAIKILGWKTAEDIALAFPNQPRAAVGEVVTKVGFRPSMGNSDRFFHQPVGGQWNYKLGDDEGLSPWIGVATFLVAQWMRSWHGVLMCTMYGYVWCARRIMVNLRNPCEFRLPKRWLKCYIWCDIWWNNGWTAMGWSKNRVPQHPMVRIFPFFDSNSNFGVSWCSMIFPILFKQIHVGVS